jgi:predicted dinucleotide-binding enzyme
MRVGIIGTGSVGSALATGLQESGHDVVVGSRSPDTRQVDGVEVVAQERAAQHGEIVILAVPADVVTDIAVMLKESLADTPVVDTTNEYPEPSPGPSVAERIADVVPEAQVVKAFNTIGANRLANPVIDGDPATMLMAGEDSGALESVGTLARDLGFEPVIAGELPAAEHLEHLARLWIDLSQKHGRDIGFRLLHESQITV